ncbi:MAG: hypothetical protein H7X77_09260 [Anaerolineae bacterium]|nr:hypothetical protein [Anaerolineae bacterium]
MKKQKPKNRNLIKTGSAKLKDNHTWQAPAGYKIVVLDRGAVSFNVPQDWLMAKADPVELHDAAPPNDNARLTVSFWRLPPGVDWTGLPLAPLLIESTKDSKMDVLERGEIITPSRTDNIELVWTQHRFMDPVEHREAFTRIAMARGWEIHALITFDFWVSEATKLQPVWDEVLRSLQMGRVIDDPTKGVTRH